MISDEVPDSKHVRHLQQILTTSLQHNSSWLRVEETPWEIVALIVPGKTSDQPMVTFALRSEADKQIRALVGATPEGKPVPIETITQSENGFLESVLFLRVVTRASAIVAELKSHPKPNTVH
jgi:hypothetical protein